MDNYKIKVNDEAESKEAQELFVQLGFEKTGFSCDEFPCYLATWEGGFSDYVLDSLNISRERKELTLPQLRDLVVLKRGDVKDATHRDKRDESIYLTSDKVIYYWQGEWCKSAINKSNDYENYIANSLTPIAKHQDPTLITGADALRALADGKDVEGFSEENEEWIPIVYFTVQEVVNGLYKFRLKPQTIKIELEIPAPFQPKEGEQCCYISDESIDGYHTVSYNSEKYSGMHFGLYRPSDIEKVVALFRSAFGGAS